MISPLNREVARAVADGFNGLRVFCDITPMITDTARRASHAHWEHFADAWMADGNPLATLCAYDIPVVGDEPQGVTAVHPLRHGPRRSVVPFGLYHGPSGRMLDGEIDAFGAQALAEALSALPKGLVEPRPQCGACGRSWDGTCGCWRVGDITIRQY